MPVTRWQPNAQRAPQTRIQRQAGSSTDRYQTDYNDPQIGVEVPDRPAANDARTPNGRRRRIDLGAALAISVNIDATEHPDGVYDCKRTTGGTGRGLWVEATVSSGTVTSVSIIRPGFGYTAGDVVTLPLLFVESEIVLPPPSVTVDTVET